LVRKKVLLHTSTSRWTTSQRIGVNENVKNENESVLKVTKHLAQ
jgi:hypothetical protein